MRNKKCPHRARCDEQNKVLELIWAFECPKKPYKDCLRFEEINNAIRDDSRPAEEHPSAVQS